jgi:hypothetical protein
MTPAMAANISDHIWTVSELIDAALAAESGIISAWTKGLWHNQPIGGTTMTQEDKLDSILAALILIRSHQLDEKAKAHGSTRIGGSYIAEAISEIENQRASVISRLK